MFRQNGFPVSLCLLCAVAGGGCGGGTEDGRLAVQPASGKVTVAGQPAAGVFVVLYPAPGTPAAQAGVKPSGTTGEDGSFRLSTYEQNDGAPAGDYAVTMRWHRADPRSAGRPAIPFGRQPPDRFRGKYNNPQTTSWRVTIREGDNELPPFEIK
jgi:hypothetical protein